MERYGAVSGMALPRHVMMRMGIMDTSYVSYMCPETMIYKKFGMREPDGFGDRECNFMVPLERHNVAVLEGNDRELTCSFVTLYGELSQLIKSKCIGGTPGLHLSRRLYTHVAVSLIGRSVKAGGRPKW